jgi:DNA polymerase III delta prime subunit
MSKQHTLWNEKYRPDILEGYLGNEEFISNLQEWISKNDFPNLLLHGTPGTGKTTAAKLIIKNIKCDHLYLNCSDENGIDTIRDKVKQFASGATFQPLKVVILDEADFLTINAQAALRNVIESFSLTTRFIFTCNYAERIIDPLQSRLTLFSLTTPDIKSIAKHLKNILEQEQIEFDTTDLVSVVKKTYPDIRRALNVLQSSINKGKLILKTNIVDNNYTNLIISELKSNKSTSFNTIRQIVADAGLNDFTGVYKELHDAYSSPEATIIIEEYLFHSTTIPDKEICFMGCVAKLLNL